MGLDAPNGGVVGLVLRPWATRPAARTRDAAEARAIGASWCFVLAPPFLSIVDARGTRDAACRSISRCLGSFRRAGLAAVRHREPGRRLCARRPPRRGSDAARRAGRAGAALPGSGPARPAARRRRRARRVIPVIRDTRRADRRHPAAGNRHHSQAQALTIVYRVLFLLFAESRDIVPARHPIYSRALRDGHAVPGRRPSDATAGSWEALAATTRLARDGCRAGICTCRRSTGRSSLEPRRPRWKDARHAAGHDRQCRDATTPRDGH